MLRICITGHRILGNPEQVRREIKYLFLFFKKGNPSIVAITSLATGADTIFAEEALKQDIPIEAVLPYEEESYKKNFKGRNLRKFDELYSKASNRINAFATKSTTDITLKQDEYYLETGKKIVEGADIVVAVWDGKPAEGTGGTGDIVAFAMKTDKELHVIKTVRPDRKHVIAKENTNIEQYCSSDKEAESYKRMFHFFWRTGIVLGLLAVACFAVNFVFKHHLNDSIRFIIACVEVAALFLSIPFLMVFAKKNKELLLEKRKEAEELRIKLWYEHIFPELTTPSVTTDFIDINSACNCFGNAKRVSWVLAQQQADYHLGVRHRRNQRYLTICNRFMNTILIVFLILAALKFLIELFEHGHYKGADDMEKALPYMEVFIIFLPSLYAALEGIKYFSNWNKNAEISKETGEEIAKISEAIFDCKDAAALKREAISLRQILDSESLVWRKGVEEGELGPII